jgi:hypothetical protein
LKVIIKLYSSISQSHTGIEAILSLNPSQAGADYNSCDTWDYFHINSVDKDRENDYIGSGILLLAGIWPIRQEIKEHAVTDDSVDSWFHRTHRTKREGKSSGLSPTPITHPRRKTIPALYFQYHNCAMIFHTPALHAMITSHCRRTFYSSDSSVSGAIAPGFLGD